MMRTQPASELIEAAGSLDELLQQRCGPSRGEGYFDRDWEPLWAELLRGGWHEIGSAITGSTPSDTLVDLAAVAEVWGKHLAPLPLVEKLYESILHDAAQAGPVAVAASGGGVWAPRALDVPDPVGSDGPLIDDFAPSLPLRTTSAEPLSPTDAMALLVLYAAEAVGAAMATFEAAREYSAVRITYGHPIGSYQAVRHLLADDHVHLQGARAGVVWAAHDPGARMDVVADVLDRALAVINDSVQIHGGIGFTWDLGLHYYLRHVMVLRKLHQSVARTVRTRGEKV